MSPRFVLQAGGVAMATALFALPVAADSINDQEPRLDLEVGTPVSGSVIGDPGGMAFISGKALATLGEFQAFDIVFVLDTSDSTASPSGADVDGDGKIGRRGGEGFASIFGKILPLPNSDRGDSVLAAEVAAVETMLDQLDPRTTRVGVVYFGGDLDPITPDAAVAVPLTTNYHLARKGLYDILRYGPHGNTNMLAGIQLATLELMGSRQALSTRRPGARRIMVFLTDGKPTLPLRHSTNQNMRMAIKASRKAAEANIRIDTYAIGEEALSDPTVTVEMAHATQGIFTPVRNPRDLRAVFEQIDFADIDELRVTNKTTGAPASYTLRNADGSFSALVGMTDGVNHVEVYARSSSGIEARRFIRLHFRADAPVQKLSPDLVSQRNRLLENRLLDLKRRSLEIEIERDEDVRRELMIGIAKERARAEAHALERRKELQIDLEDE